MHRSVRFFLGISGATGNLAFTISPTSSASIQAIKLELGTSSTLAADPPMDYGKELVVCRRYFQVISAVRARAGQVTTDSIEYTIFLDTPMRIVPALSSFGSSNIAIRGWPLLTPIDGFIFSIAGAANIGIIRLIAIKANHGLTDSTSWINELALDANL